MMPYQCSVERKCHVSITADNKLSYNFSCSFWRGVVFLHDEGEGRLTAARQEEEALLCSLWQCAGMSSLCFSVLSWTT